MQQPVQQKPTSASAFKKVMASKEIGILIPLILICVITTIINPVFMSASNVINLLRSISVTLIGAIGMTFVLISGGLDLSVGSTLALSGMVSGYCMSVVGMGTIPSIVIGLVAGCLVGLINGLIITKLSIPPLIVTLGMMNIARGLVNVMSKGRPYSGFTDAFNAIGQGSFLGVPYSVFIALVLAILAGLMIKYTVFGRSVMAIGGNEETTRVSGVNIHRYKILTYVMMSFFAGVVGLLMASRLGSAQANAGSGWEMTIIASVVIGGTSMFGGSGSILGTVIGVAIMEALTVAMTMLRIDPYWQKVVVGAIIILAVGIDTARRRRMSGNRG